MLNFVESDYEAKSSRDGAWYDVDRFQGHQMNEAGQQEVKVRYAGFSEEEDEWVLASTCVRLRSLPCEASECIGVLPGDLVLCFQEGNEQALYYDADILDVQRRRHDVRGCRCRFWVRYRHDLAEEVVPLRKICRRPETEFRIQAAVQAQAALASQQLAPHLAASVGTQSAGGKMQQLGPHVPIAGS
eukprot:jgi/Mesen1/9495/ME000063S08945